MILRGEIYRADLTPVVGSEQGGVRPVLVIQNNVGNRYSPTVIVAAITSKLTKARLPTHIELLSGEGGLSRDSVVLAEQIRTIDKQRLQLRIGLLSDEALRRVDEALRMSLAIADLPEDEAG
ncbi:MAG: type II toxin-antitoxin system PemK/MazF family toxin [Christensenellaceae bacterium]|jgi:mRNA interferase MazF|nr:type II toxin-antitoxin system PemK/MazF family toxin [Christensenellaceae bacterium]